MRTPASVKGGPTMSITATELKLNSGKYLQLAESEDIYITRNGKVIAKLTNHIRTGWTRSSPSMAFCPPM